ncbi:MurR/RpiR family transcriptional regulator [Mediterraneibacter agrestimuris]|uniref:MurR/RpiR family transcriptional regulator n=1 Tax=Mediterraneibacter agrestimuris TaxID=2941333 RepID=UPI00203CC83D|nr:MurR/RpiR family transcriptional regulator [Mediterraneibacter agrestimuris]
MNNTNIILQIQATYNQLTRTEKKVADYVLQNRSSVLYMSITDLADASEVGDTSVYRFCRTLGLQGYQEFKMKLSLSFSDSEESVGSSSEDGDAEETLSHRIMQMHMNAIRESYMLLDHSMLDKFVRMMENARRIFFFGVGDSLLTAEEARNKFLRIIGKVICISDPHMQSMAASTATEEDLIIIISYSGATKDNIHVANEAKEAGAGIAVITHFKKSPLTAYADAVLLCGAEESPLDGGSMSAKMGQLYLIDLLYQEYYARSYKECRENNKRTSRAVVKKLF